MATDETPSTDIVYMSAGDAMRAMESGDVPARLHVTGDVSFYREPDITRHVSFYREPDITRCRALPTEELVADSVIIHDGRLLTHWPRVVRCHHLLLSAFQLDFMPDTLIELIGYGDAPDTQSGSLTLSDCPHVTRLPMAHAGVTHEISIRNCPKLESLPNGLRATNVLLANCVGLREMPDDFVVSETINLFGCANLTHLPDTVESMRLNLTDCRSLTELPPRLRSRYVSLDGCVNLTRWDDPEVTALRQLSARGCVKLEALPPNLRQIDELDVSGCSRLTSLPAELRVTRWVDVGASGVRALPASAQGVQVRWNGVNVTGQIAFHPETLTVRQALSAENAEIRRVMLERIGSERFFAEAQPKELDADTDRGGARCLLRVDIPGDEALVALQVRDPSTGRVYLLRVPPMITSCRRAAAWIAGFDNPNDYAPVMET